MKAFTLLIVTVCAALWASCSATVELSSGQQEASLSWLASVDSADYSESWTQASESFQSAVSESTWIEKVRMARGPLGALAARAQKQAATQTNPAGAPDGNYIIVTYDSSFENKAEATETHSLVQEQDGAWRTAGYFIK